MEGGHHDAGVLLGTHGFGYPRWVGPFYPGGTRGGAFLRVYSRQFPLVELDTTAYRIPAPEQIARWREVVPEGFRFAAKVPRLITHDRRLQGVSGELAEFLGVMAGLGPHLGPILFQFGPQFRYPADWPALRRTLNRLPTGFRYAVEFRHAGWWRDDVETVLRDLGVAWVLNDLPGVPRAIDGGAAGRVTAGFTYIRLVGDHGRPTSQDRILFDRAEELDRWAALIDGLRPQLDTVYLTANNHYEGHAPATLRRLAARLDLALPAPGTGAARWTQARLFADAS